MIFVVELLAFGNGEIREVDAKTITHPDLDFIRSEQTIAEVACQEVFYWGQNENQPQDNPSVSAGDVIHINQDRWLIMAVGFKKLTPSEYLLYKEMPRDKRLMIPYLSTP